MVVLVVSKPIKDNGRPATAVGAKFNAERTVGLDGLRETVGKSDEKPSGNRDVQLSDKLQEGRARYFAVLPDHPKCRRDISHYCVLVHIAVFSPSKRPKAVPRGHNNSDGQVRQY